jgi:predicted metal-binding membrane protein
MGGLSAAGPLLGGDAEPGELSPAFAAVRARLGLVVLLLALAAAAWWSTVDRMAGMDAGPGTDLGTLGWFLGVWVVMMAAMMFPSLAPTMALYARMTRRRGWARPVSFSAGYLFSGRVSLRAAVE